MKPAFKAPEFLTPDLSLELQDFAFSSRRCRNPSDQETRPESHPLRGGTDEVALVRENRLIQRMLDDRDRQFASLQRELSIMRRDWVWRTIALLRHGVRRARRQFWMTASAAAEARRVCSLPAGRGTAA